MPLWIRTDRSRRHGWPCAAKTLWRRLADDLGIVGIVRRFELTLSENGWHPHFHVSLLCAWAAAQEVKGHSRRAALNDVHALVAGAWDEAGRKIGLAVSLHAQAAVALVSAADGLKPVGYNTKNLGYANKRGSLTPMDLLRIVDQSNDHRAIRAAKRLFGEYADALKGKHALTFSGVARTTKAAVAEAAVEPKRREEEDRLGIIAPAGWSAIVKAGLREAVAQVKTRGELEAVMLRGNVGRQPQYSARLAGTHGIQIRNDGQGRPSGAECGGSVGISICAHCLRTTMRRTWPWRSAIRLTSSTDRAWSSLRFRAWHPQPLADLTS